MQTLKRLLKGRPDTNAENPKYVAEMVEALAYLSPTEMEAITDPREGLQTTCRYLPTPADVFGFLRASQARQEAIRPAPTTWKKLDPDDPVAPWNLETDAERKRRAVRELLGYDPDNRNPQIRPLTPPAAEDFARIVHKIEPAPPSKYLKAVLREQGWLGGTP